MNHIAPDRRKRFIYWQERQVVLRADGVTAPSRAVAQLTATWLSLDQEKVSVVPNPINTDVFSPGLAHRPSEVLFVGRLERGKGADTLVQALPLVLQRCPGVSFRFVGADGVDENGCSWRERLLSGIVSSDRGRILFQQVPRDALIARYRQAALCVLPSIWENFPYALLEAMACGTPVVASRTGGVPEMVEDGLTGRLVPPEDPISLADAITEMMLDPAHREDVGRNARARVEQLFSMDRVVPRMVGAYQMILGGC